MADWGLFRTLRQSLVWSHGWLTPLFLIVIPIVLVWVSIVSHLDQERTLSELAGLEDAANLARGFGENEELLEDLRDEADRIAEELAEDGITEIKLLQEHMHDAIAKLVYARTRRRPMILPVVIEV